MQRHVDRARPVGRGRGRVRSDVGPPRRLQRIEDEADPPCVEVAAGAGHADQGATGVLQFKDDVVNLKYDWRGHISLE